MEELGVIDALLQPLGPPRPQPGTQGSGHWDREWQQAFITCHDGPFNPDRGEVADLRFVGPAELEAWIAREPLGLTPWLRRELRERPVTQLSALARAAAAKPLSGQTPGTELSR
jgi:hypothetical protein